MTDVVGTRARPLATLKAPLDSVQEAQGLIAWYEQASGEFLPMRVQGTADGELKVSATLDASDIEIGAVELKNGTSDARGVVDIPANISTSSNTLSVHDPVVGLTTDAAVVTDANGSLTQFLRGIVKLLSTGTGTVIGQGYTSVVDNTRANDATPYTAGDCVGGNASAVYEFTNMGANGGHIIVTDTALRIDTASIPAGMTSFRLHLYNATPPSAYADNAAWDLPAGDRAAYLGYLDLGNPVDVGSTLYVQQTGVNKKLKLLANTSLFAYLVSNAGYTPTALTVKSVQLNAFGA